MGCMCDQYRREPMLRWREEDVTVNGLRLRVYRAGDEARPAVVLSHGVTDSGLCWPDVAPALAEAYHVVAYDARNHGRSGHTSEVYGWEELGDDEAGLIRALGLERVALVGHSMGAGTAAACAARHPELVRCAMLEDPPWMNTPPGATDRGAAYRKLQTMSVEELVAQARRDTPQWDPAILPPWAEAKGQFNVAIAELYRPAFAEWPQTAQAIACPVLLLTGEPERGARMTAVESTQAAALFQEGRVVHIPGAGHNIRRDQLGLYLEAVLPFLRAHS
jgi:N-formylmaleamate deformylase